jgi:hypothetical protein
MGFNAYFLIAWDFVTWAKDDAHRPGSRGDPGRVERQRYFEVQKNGADRGS